MKHKQYSLLIAIIILLLGCDGSRPNSVSRTTGEMLFAPPGAVLIKDHGDLWTEWQLGSSCFLSYNLAGRSGLLATIPCSAPKGAEAPDNQKSSKKD